MSDLFPGYYADNRERDHLISKGEKGIGNILLVAHPCEHTTSSGRNVKNKDVLRATRLVGCKLARGNKRSVNQSGMVDRRQTM